ncbi:hypothetical protein I79_019582 [Cricetulus griseus]|uniref:Uncharacterized protein n=1 Tax=Cricetulus griseus TaxID=10029 RepID=G3I7T4_CRIGR|nr:hypothetical protein I79_019582 [Cricetulus griseus]
MYHARRTPPVDSEKNVTTSKKKHRIGITITLWLKLLIVDLGCSSVCHICPF